MCFEGRMTMKVLKRNAAFAAAALCLLCICLLFSLSAFATEAEPDPAAQQTGATGTDPNATDPNSTPAPAPVQKKPRWVTKKGYCYHYNTLGKKDKGLVKIGKRKYLFDKKGRQQVGWQKVGKYYYYFRIRSGRQGYMLTDQTVNHIRLRKNGRATVTSGDRIRLLYRCSQIVEGHTKPTMSKSEKMHTMWNWMQSNIGYWNVIWHESGDWDVDYATRCLPENSGGGSCEGLGCLWAYLANACGASSCYSVCSGGHGWAEVEGLVYDPACARYDSRRDDYYALSMDMSGVGGRPNYRAYGFYSKQV